MPSFASLSKGLNCVYENVWILGISFWATMLLHGLFHEYVVMEIKKHGKDLGFFLPFLTNLSQLFTAFVFLLSSNINLSCLSRSQQQQQQGQTRYKLDYSSQYPVNAHPGSSLLSCIQRFFQSTFIYRNFQAPKLEHFISGFAIATSHGAAGKASMKMPFSTHSLFKSGKVLFVLIAERLLLKSAMPRSSYVYALFIGAGLILISISDTTFMDFVVGTIIDPPEIYKEIDLYDDSSILLGAFILAFSTLVGAVANVAQQAALQGRSFFRSGRPYDTSNISLISYDPYLPSEVPSILPTTNHETNLEEQASLLPDTLIDSTGKSGSKSETFKIRKDSAELDEMKKKMIKSRNKEALIFYSNFISAVILGVVCQITGELSSGIDLFFISSDSPILYELSGVLLAILGQRLILSLSQKWGATSATLFVTLRRVSTFAFSFIYFPKKLSSLHLIGMFLVLGSSISLQNELDSVEREREKRAENNNGMNVELNENPSLEKKPGADL